MTDAGSSTDLGMALRIGRLAAHMGQAEAGAAVGVSQQALSNWECNRRVPTLRQAERLAHLYQIDLRSLASLNRRALP